MTEIKTTSTLREQVVKGRFAKYRGSWAYIVLVRDNKVWLSNWRGVKTTVAKLNRITRVRDLDTKREWGINPTTERRRQKMNLEELITDITTELRKTLEDPKKELDGDDLDTAQSTIEAVLDEATEAIDSDQDEGDEEASE